MIPEPEGVTVLKVVVEFLESRGLRYWLARGRFRHFSLPGEFGNSSSDIDFHVLRASEANLRAALPELRALGYVVTDNAARHNLSLGRARSQLSSSISTKRPRRFRIRLARLTP